MIKQATVADVRILAELAIEMWDENTVEGLAGDFAEIISGENAVCYILYEEENPVGFAQCQLRFDYVEGTETSPVGYLEGIFIREEFRYKGLAKDLLQACQQWAKEKGCTEFASDCELDNVDSFRFHLAMGFQEANRVICFTKEI